MSQTRERACTPGTPDRRDSRDRLLSEGCAGRHAGRHAVHACHENAFCAELTGWPAAHARVAVDARKSGATRIGSEPKGVAVCARPDNSVCAAEAATGVAVSARAPPTKEWASAHDALGPASARLPRRVALRASLCAAKGWPFAHDRGATRLRRPGVAPRARPLAAQGWLPAHVRPQGGSFRTEGWPFPQDPATRHAASHPAGRRKSPPGTARGGRTAPRAGVKAGWLLAH